MPLELRRKKGSPNWYIRGTYLGEYVEQSTGTDNERIARRKLTQEEARIERGAVGIKALRKRTFIEAVGLYVDDGGEERFLPPLIRHFKGWMADEIGQDEIDEAAKLLYPKGSPDTLNRQVYTPMSAILRKAADKGWRTKLTLKRPRAVRKERKAAPPEWIASILPHCRPNLKALIVFLHFTGARVGEAVNMTWDDVDLRAGTALIRQTKTGTKRTVGMPSELVAAIANIPDRTGRVFGYSNRWSVNTAVKRICEKHEMKFYSSHEFGRHAMATGMLKKGRTLKYIQEAGGWASIELVAKVYGHLERSDVDAARQDLADDLFGKNPGKRKRKVGK